MYGMEVVAQIIETFNEQPHPEFGLFFVNKYDLTKCYWLDLTKTLRYYEIHNMDELVYKQVREPLRIKLMDGSRKVIMCDMSLPVKALVETICEKQGISNPEEFSLMIAEDEMTDEQREERERDLKKRRKRGEPISDDEWLKADMTLNAQGIPSGTMLLLKKKFFFYDASIDASDKQTLNLLYEQLCDDVVSGALPVRFDEAILFSALMAQVTLGQHNPDKHRKGKVDVRLFVPVEFKKTKKLPEKVFSAHAKLGPLAGDDARLRFVQLARSLETFGITIFRVQEPVRDKNGKITKKFEPVLLGISKSHLFRLDPISKAQREPPFGLTQLRRWAPSKTSITLDYGDHKDEYYTVLTDEGGKISALISGYIDIILSQRRDRQRIADADEQRAIEEELIAPSQAQGVSRSHTAMRKSTMASIPNHNRARRPGPGASFSASPSASTPINKKDLSRNLNSLASSLSSAPVMEPAELPDDIANLPDDDDSKLSSLQNARDLLADILGDLALSGNDMLGAKGRDNTAVLSAAQRMTLLSDELAGAASSLAGHMGDSEPLGDALKDVQGKLAALVAAAGADGNDDLVAAASRDLGAAMDSLLAAAAIPDASLLCMDDLLGAASDLSKALNDMVGLGTADSLDDAVAKKKLADAQAKIKAQSDALANTVALAGASLLDDRLQASLDAQEAALATSLVDMLSLADVSGVGAADLESLKAAAANLSTALGKLSDSVADADENIDRTALIAQSSTALDSAIAAVVNAESDSKMLATAKGVTVEAATLGELAEADAAAETNPEIRDHLLELSSLLAKHIESLTGCIASAKSGGSDAASAEEVKDAALRVGDAAHAIRSSREQKRALTDLAKATKSSASANVVLLEELEAAGESSAPATVKKARSAADKVAEPNEAAAQAAQLYLADPTNRSAQKALLESSKALAHPVSRLVVTSKSAAASFTDPGSAGAVAASAENAGKKTAVLKDAYASAQGVCWDLDVEAALDRMQGAQGDLESASSAAKDGSLPEKEFYETEDAALAAMQFSMEALSNASGVLVAASANLNPHDVGTAATNAASNVEILANAVITAQKCKAPDAGRSDPTAIDRASDVTTAMAALLSVAEARNKSSVTDASSEAEAAQAAAALKEAMAAMLETIPGVGACLTAESEVSARAASLDLATLPSSPSGSPEGISDDLIDAAKSLMDALALLSHGARLGSTSELERGAQGVTESYNALADGAVALATALPDAKARIPILNAAKSVGETTVAASRDARSLAQDADDEDAARDAAISSETASSALAEFLAVIESAAEGGDGGELDSVIDAMLATIASKLAKGANAAPSGASYAESTKAIKKAKKTIMAVINVSSPDSPDQLVSAIAPLPAALDTLASATVDAASSNGGASGESSSSAAGNGDLEGVDVKKVGKNGTSIRAGVKALSKSAATKPKATLKAAAAVIKLANALVSASKAGGGDIGKMAKALKAASSKLSKASATAAKGLAGGEADLTPVVAAASIVSKGARAVMAAVAKAQESPSSSAAAGAGAGASTNAALVTSARKAAEALIAHVTAIKSWAAKPESTPAQSLVRSSGRKTKVALEKLEGGVMAGAPGQADVAAALKAVDAGSDALEESSMAASVGDLSSTSKLTFATVQKRLGDVLNAIEEHTGSCLEAEEAEDFSALGTSARALGKDVGALVKLVQAAAAGIVDEPEDQAAVLGAGLSLSAEIRSVLDGSSDGSAEPVEAAIGALQEAIAAAADSVEGASGGSGTSAPAMVAAAAEILSSGNNGSNSRMTYKEYQSDIKAQGKKLGSKILHLGKAAKRAPKKVGAAVKEVAALYGPLMTSVAGAAPSSSAPEALKEAAADLCRVSMALFEEAEELAGSPKDKKLQSAVAKGASSKVAKRIAALLAAAKAEASAERDAEEAAIAIEEALGELDTLSFMVTSGNLKSASDASYGEYEAGIAKSATKVGKAMLKLEAAASAGDSDATSGAAQNLAAGVTALLAGLEGGVPALADLGAQKALLDAAKALTEALAGFANSAVSVAEDPSGEEAASAMSEAKETSTKELKKFLKVNSKVEELATSGKRQVSTAIKLAEEAVASLDAPAKAGDKDDGTLEEVDAAASSVGSSATKFVVKAKKGETTVVGESASDLVRKLVAFVLAARALGPGVEPEIRAPFVAAAKDLGGDVVKMLKVVKAAGGSTKKSSSAHKALRKEGSKVADDVAEVLATGLVVSNPELAGEGSADAMAATELKNTAKEIESSGLKKLNRLRPERGVDGLMSLEEQLVEGAKTIMVAAAGLIKAAAMCQKEVMAHQAKGVDADSVWATDSDFSTGLISAAQRVNAECKLLVTTAETVVKDKPDNPSLRIKAVIKGITSSTVHLCVAAQVRAGDSKPQKLLKKAGGDVKRTAEALDMISDLAAKAAAGPSGGGGGDDSDDELDDEGQVAANRADMEARLAVLAAQAELEKARNAVLKRNKAKSKRKKK